MKRIFTFIGLSVLLGSAIMAQSFPTKASSRIESHRKNDVIQNAMKPVWKKTTEQNPQRLDGNKVVKKTFKDAEFRRKATTEPITKRARRPILKSLGRTKKAVADDKATITLIAADVWEDGTGYQMLLDADHDTYGRIIPLTGGLTSGGDAPQATYDEFEYKIPENADGSLTTVNVLIGDEGSVDIPEGTYDFCITNPAPEERVWIVGEGPGRFDDYFFEAGYTYTFEVDGDMWGDYVIHDMNVDLVMEELILPPNSVDLTNNENIQIIFTNEGLYTAEGIKVNYQVNGGNIITENHPNVPSGETVTYDFSAKADFSAPGVYRVKAWIDCSKDFYHVNDSILASCKNPFVITLPFSEDFSTLDNVIEYWNIVDANEDEITWFYLSNADYPDADDGVGCMMYEYSSYDDADDYLITNPITMNAGAHNIKMYYHGETDYPEKLEVLYGTSLDPGQMTRLKLMENIQRGVWQFDVINFTVPAAGNYYVAFRVVSDADQYHLGLDNISISEGTFVGVPDLSADMVILPASGCELSAQSTIQAVFTNLGSEPITRFTASYSINGGTPVSQIYDQRIDIWETVTVTFDTKADFSTPGVYDITLQGTCDAQQNTENDIAEGRVYNFVPATVPFVTDFMDEEDALEWNPEVADSWEWNESAGVYSAVTSGTPLISRCITLPVGVYDLSYEYIAGYSFLGIIEVPDDYQVWIGKSGTSSDSWKLLADYTEIYTADEFVTDEIQFEVDEEGEYIIAYIVTSNGVGHFQISSITVKEPVDHDIRISRFISSFSSQVPVYHANGAVEFYADVVNRGKNAENGVKLSVSAGETVIGTSDPVQVPLGGEVELYVEGLLDGFSVGDRIRFNGTVSMDNEDGFAEDNVMEMSVLVNDSTFIWDDTYDFTDGVGSSVPITLGNVFVINKADILTSVNLGFGEKEEGLEFKFRVCEVNEDGILASENIIYETYNRDAAGGIKTFLLPQKELKPGKYFFAVEQLTETNVVVGCDVDPEGYLFMESGGLIEVVDGFGYLCIRPNFGLNDLTGLNDIGLDQKLNVYYDPNSKSIIVNAADCLVEQISVYDMAGRMIIESGRGTQALNFSEFMKGVYIVTLKTNVGTETVKIIK